LHAKALGYSLIVEIPEGLYFDGGLLVVGIEHFVDLWQVIEILREMHKPDGGLNIASSNAAAIKSVIQKDAWEQAMNPEHLYLRTCSTLERVLLESELSPKRLRRFVAHADCNGQIFHRLFFKC
jgi:hypothetical protein